MTAFMAPPSKSALPVELNEVTELSLLLPGWQFSSLIEAAAAEGITAGQFVRRLLTHALAGFGRTKPTPLENFAPLA